MLNFRLPRGEALEITRAAEVFERTIEIVLEHVQQGHQFNFSRYSECFLWWYIYRLINCYDLGKTIILQLNKLWC